MINAGAITSTSLVGGASAAEREGRIDCLVNNAGLGTFGPVDELTGDQWREVIDTNLSGCFYFLHAVAPVMKRQGTGWIFNIASLAGKNPFAGGAAYNASKFGALGLSLAVRAEVAGAGVSVSAVLPSAVRTGLVSGVPLGRGMPTVDPEDVARAIVASGSREKMERHVQAMHEYGLWATLDRADA